MRVIFLGVFVQAAAIILGGSIASPVQATEGGVLDEVTYELQTGDLFPDEESVDLSFSYSSFVNWGLQPGNIRAGKSLERFVEPEAGAATWTISYSYSPVCCPGQNWTGTKTIEMEARVGCVPVSWMDENGVTYTITFCAEYRAANDLSGQGSISPASNSWDSDWNPKRVDIAAYSDAEASGTLALTVNTFLDATAKGQAEYSGASIQSNTRTIDSAQGSPNFLRTFQIGEKDRNDSGGSGGETKEGGNATAPSVGVLFVALASFLAVRRRRT